MFQNLPASAPIQVPSISVNSTRVLGSSSDVLAAPSVNPNAFDFSGASSRPVSSSPIDFGYHPKSKFVLLNPRVVTDSFESSTVIDSAPLTKIDSTNGGRITLVAQTNLATPTNPVLSLSRENPQLKSYSDFGGDATWRNSQVVLDPQLGASAVDTSALDLVPQSMPVIFPTVQAVNYSSEVEKALANDAIKIVKSGGIDLNFSVDEAVFGNAFV